MDNRGDRQRLLQLQPHDDSDEQRGRRLLDIVDNSFASTCQAVRTNKDVCVFGCGKLLAPRTIDYHRLNGCRGRQEDAFADLSRKRSFTCGACYEEFISRDSFFEHLSTSHAVQATIREYVFPDLITFERFRFWLEAQGGAHFRQKSGAKNRPTGKGIFMMCNRSGLVHSSAATGEPEKDRLGSYRMGYTCSAFINGTIFKDGHVSIRYCGDHYGHDARVRLPQSVKNIIMHMQNTGRPNGLIVRYLQDHFVPIGHTSIHAQRAAYVDLEELRSIAPIFKRLDGIPFHREEEWEQEFLESAGIVRDWAPEPAERPAGWLPIKELAALKDWAPPLVYKAKVRNDAGDWMVYDEHRSVYVPESSHLTTTTTTTPRNKHYLDELEELEEHYDTRHQQQQRGDRAERGGGGKGVPRNGAAASSAGSRHETPEEEDEDEVDVEELRESTKEQGMPLPVASTSAASFSPTAAAAKRRRLDHSEAPTVAGRAAAEQVGRTPEEAEEHEPHEEDDHGEPAEGASVNGGIMGDPPSPENRSGFLTSSIFAELEMIRTLVKAESQFLPDPELASYLRQTRSLRLAFEPLLRGARNAAMQMEFAVPRVTRPSRALSARAITHLRERRSDETHLIIGPHDIDVCDEEVVVGAAGGRGVQPERYRRRLRYNAGIWS